MYRAVASHLLVGGAHHIAGGAGRLNSFSQYEIVHEVCPTLVDKIVRDLAYFWRCFRCVIVRLPCVAIAMTDSMQF